MLVLLEDVMVPIIALFDGFRIVKMEGVDKLLPFIVNQVSLQSLLCSLFCGLRSLRVWILLYSFVYIFRVLKAGKCILERKLLLARSLDIQLFESGLSFLVSNFTHVPGRQEGELDPDS
ncbi:uncharacterized protein LOC132609375 isoform X8 [Lycium barbarum]|uniref:uncharacterized protein LOC132609375 isoform X8 n=1 Tax=Lycium barbarum TaxID=112863 RepID=UPI00293F35B3|nr:uncharacterized protein LOC132609375 isoform X8 [Lycium barbarum]